MRLDPRWHQAALRFVEVGLLRTSSTAPTTCSSSSCLVIPFRRFLPLVAIVTAFTVAHSITLVATALRPRRPTRLWFPPLVETLIAVSIVYMALENILGRDAAGGAGSSRSPSAWCTASASRSRCASSLQFAGSHLVTSLLAFNLGVELGQLLVLAVLVPALNLLFRYVKESVGTLLLSLFVGHTAWHWMVERSERLAKFPWPGFDPGAIAGAIRWAMALLILAGLAWLASEAIQRSRKRKPR